VGHSLHSRFFGYTYTQLPPKHPSAPNHFGVGDMKSLSDVDTFGAIDADNDQLLLPCFEDHEAYLDVRNQKRFLVVGRKGSGKTAIFKKLLGIDNPGYFCFGHTFSDYPWHYHDKQARMGIPDFDKYTHSWKYLILLTLAKIILNQDQSLPHDDRAMESMASVERFVVDTYGSRDPDVTQIFTPSKRLRLRPYIDVDFKLLKAGVSPESVPMEDLPTVVQDVNKNLLRFCMDCLNPANEYFVCFDQLDLGFDPTKDDYSNRLIRLLLACRDINIASKEAGKKVFVAVFLRHDIYETLHFEDKNKITENFLSSIEWDAPGTTKTLRELMEKRFDVVLRDESGSQVRWGDVFDETSEMPGHQTKYRHILDRTYLRPRDIIRFCNSILKQYQIRAKAGSGGDTVDGFANIDINKARPDYSHYLLNELDDEVHKHLPNYKVYMSILEDMGVWQFTREEFEKGCQSLKFAGRVPTATSKVLEELFEFSIIGFYRVGGKGYGGSEYVFRYKEARTAFDISAPRFRIHPGFIDALGLKRFTLSEETEP
jgi:energy-coupling factor transporter ATP-binding protein EcfA2